MSGIMGIGLRSLIAYQTAIQTTAQNLENARTPFYSRRQVQMVESMFNNGVHVADVRRVFDEVSNKNLLDSTSAANSLNKLFEGISDFEKLLDNDTTNINKYINDSLKSLQDLSTSVGSVQSRSAYLAQLSSLTARIRSVGADIQKRKNDTNQSITNTVTHVNDVIRQISDFNTSISKGIGADRASLLDQRNASLHELAKYINFDTVADENDAINVTLSNGLEIISNTQYKEFSIQSDNNDVSKLRLMIGEGATLSDATNLISGGEIHGMMSLRNEGLEAAERGLGRLALGLSAVFNKQNRLGADLDGNLGGNIFSDINSAAMKSNRVSPNTLNVGSATMDVTIDDVSALGVSDYKLNFIDATHYNLIRISDNKSIDSGVISGFPATISAEGFSVKISAGTFNAGDSYSIKPTKNAMQSMTIELTDPKKLALAFPVSAEGSKSNKGIGVINVDSILDTNNLSFANTKQLNPPIRIEFLSDTSYQLVNSSTNTVLEGPLTYDPNTTNIFPTAGGYDPGYRVSLKGDVKAGDQFDVNYNSNTSGDNRNALIFGELYTKKIFDNGALSFNDAYHLTANGVSLKTYSTKVDLDSAIAIFNQAEQRFAQISGVSNVEEVANLAQFQESYQASAQVIQVAKSIFETIINLSR